MKIKHTNKSRLFVVTFNENNDTVAATVQPFPLTVCLPLTGSSKIFDCQRISRLADVTQSKHDSMLALTLSLQTANRWRLPQNIEQAP